MCIVEPHVLDPDPEEVAGTSASVPQQASTSSSQNKRKSISKKTRKKRRKLQDHIQVIDFKYKTIYLRRK